MAAKPIKPLEMCYPCNDPVFNNKLYFTHSLFKKKNNPRSYSENASNVFHTTTEDLTNATITGHFGFV